MKRLLHILFAAAIAAGCSSAPEAHQVNALRAPAYPLITIDPYTSAWSFDDVLYGSQVKHWTGKEFPLVGVLTVDGQDYRFMGETIFQTDVVAASGAGEPWPAKYVFDEPVGDWMAVDYDDSAWKDGFGAFTLPKEAGATLWDTEHIWVRREIEINEDLTGKTVYLEYSNDDDASIYFNGKLALDTGKDWNHGTLYKLPEETLALLHEGRNVIAATCWNRVGDAAIDMGILKFKEDVKEYPVTAVQTYADVQATQTHYGFKCGPVDLRLSFTAPLLMDDLDLLSRPVNYISYDVESNDGRAHEISIHFEATAAWALNQKTQGNEVSAYEKDGLLWLKAGSKTQNILGIKGDDVRIDWGWFYLVSDAKGASSKAADGLMELSRGFGKRRSVHDHVMIAYDDIYSIQYFGENLRPYWNRNGDKTIEEMVCQAQDAYAEMISRCDAFDSQLMADAEKAGGRRYAELCALAYRQAIAAHKLVESPDAGLLWLSKENFSNGSIGTVDVTYPSAPLFLLYNPELAKGLLNHIFHYAESGRWAKPFPAHDVGTYPHANGQTYGGDMPVEEAGNVITLTAAICHYTQDWSYARKHWDKLTEWTDYLVEAGMDPENQLCTDDFAGHFAHNVNLSAKAIVAIASYAQMAEALGMSDDGCGAKAREMAAQWMAMADDGDHYRLTFDQPGTWSQKYNLVWDKLLGLNVFPEEVSRKELAYYGTVQNQYGLPLDCRKAYTKLDWIMWTATMAESQEQFESFIDPVWDFVNETVDRTPMSDWTWTDSPKHEGFTARSVVGGYFIKMLISPR